MGLTRATDRFSAMMLALRLEVAWPFLLLQPGSGEMIVLALTVGLAVIGVNAYVEDRYMRMGQSFWRRVRLSGKWSAANVLLLAIGMVLSGKCFPSRWWDWEAMRGWCLWATASLVFLLASHVLWRSLAAVVDKVLGISEGGSGDANRSC